MRFFSSSSAARYAARSLAEWPCCKSTICSSSPSLPRNDACSGWNFPVIAKSSFECSLLFATHSRPVGADFGVLAIGALAVGGGGGGGATGVGSGLPPQLATEAKRRTERRLGRFIGGDRPTSF